MTQSEMQAFAEQINEKPFRGRQLFGWIYAKKASRFDEMTDLSKSLRAKLAETAAIGHLCLEGKSLSHASGSTKYLFRLSDSKVIESVYIPEGGRKTLCISSQVGCGMHCAFCATAQLGFMRNLIVGEIVDQVLYVERDQNVKLSNIVFMGMGEPFHNYDQVIKAADLISHADGIAIGHRRIVISTVGLVSKIIQYSDEGQPFRLAVSLNSPFSEVRQKIMPITKKWDVAALLEAVSYYAKKSRLRPTIEYVLIAGINDREQDALELRRLLQNIPCKVNLIPYNAAIAGFQRPSAERIDQFARWLLPLRAPLTVRWSKGDDINGACGQLAAQVHKNN